MDNECVVFLAWGDSYIDEVRRAVDRSPGLNGRHIVLITDHESRTRDVEPFEVIRADFSMDGGGYARKSEFHKFVPAGFESYLYLDSDVTVIGDISLGFQMARKFGIALVQANEYSLTDFKDFFQVMSAEGVPVLGQTQFNAGVIFFDGSERSKEALSEWERLCQIWLTGPSRRLSDQPFLSLAIAKVGVAAYCLTRNFNFRPRREPVVGEIRIWHSWRDCPEDINQSRSWRFYDPDRKKMVPVAVRSHWLKRFAATFVRFIRGLTINRSESARG